ncbi:hypothetical protein THRCLA_23354 [Thraustotheca clavata]|uniref:Protein FAM136A n=1 Tax=Thraustotheca clavata TaxID=74557 RepID=A0A1V9Y762_9STRA|nr:hypothetical protein THRCLA_23354 [Thraustotheca clavata]
MAENDINHAVGEMMDKLERSLFRPMQRKSYEDVVKCFDNKNCSSEQLQHCIDRCQAPMQQVQNYVSQEIQQFQNRLQRAARECQDQAQDNLPRNPSESQIAAAQASMDTCINTCVKNHIKLLPTIKKRIEDTVSSIEM